MEATPCGTNENLEFPFISNGHSGKKSPILRSADKAAKAAAAHPTTDDDHGYRPGTIARSMVKGAAARFPAIGQVAAIRPYRKALSVKGEEKIRFDTFSETTGTYLASFYAFATSELTVELHRGNGYRVRFNDNTSYPQILEIIAVVELPKVNKLETRHLIRLGLLFASCRQ